MRSSHGGLVQTFDVVIVGATPGGIMAAIGAARGGASVALLERNRHIGGLPANGLGATDIKTRSATGGLFKEFVQRVHSHYQDTYGEGSEQLRDCSGGYHFEPKVAESVLEAMLAAQPTITVLRLRQFDALPENVTLQGSRLTGVVVKDRRTGLPERYAGKVFVDATYEGDLAAAAGAPFRTYREAAHEHNEPLAGKVYCHWFGPLGSGSTFEADDAIQAYNYRLCLTDEPQNRVPIAKPAAYMRDDYASLVEDVSSGRVTSFLNWQGKVGVVNPVKLPNKKTDSNNHHEAFVSTDLPKENWPWPSADWAWRDGFAQRLRDYTLGLLWFCQHDPELPHDFREDAKLWGLAGDEYVDNDNFPRQVYVREGRRIEGDQLFTANDTLAPGASLRPPVNAPWRSHPLSGGLVPHGRPPIYTSSVTASHYAIDSHAVRKREPGRVHLDGFLNYPTQPYTVPYGIMLPKGIEGLLTPVPVSATHLGYGTLRMEPCWMALGHAAGVAAAISLRAGVTPRHLQVERLQEELMAQGAILIFFTDVSPTHPNFAALQFFGLRGFLPEWQARPDEAMTREEADRWLAKVRGNRVPEFEIGRTTRAQFLESLYWAQARGEVVVK